MWDKLAVRAGRTWRPWAILVPGMLAPAAAGLFAAADLAGMVMGSWDIPMPGLRWLEAGAVGQGAAAVAATVALAAGLAYVRWRRTAVITAGAVILLEVAWFLLPAYLFRRS